MRLLLDTCTFLWIVAGSPELSTHAREIAVDPANDVYLSAVSPWEIALKHALGHLPLPEPPDRMLVAQAIVHGLVVLGPDPLVSQYPVRAMW